MVKPLSLLWNRIKLGSVLTACFALLLGLQLWFIDIPTAMATSVSSIPSLQSSQPIWILDQATTLSRITRNEISGELEKLAQQTGTEVRFVTLHRLDYGETAQDFAEKLFKRWFPTAEAQANQVLIVLDNVTNTTAIQTGSAVQERLSDEIAQSVVQETMMVPLRDGNKYNQAFLDASDRLVAVISGEPDPGPPIIDENVQTEGTFARAEETDDRSATVIVVVLLVLATVIPMATYYFYQSQS